MNYVIVHDLIASYDRRQLLYGHHWAIVKYERQTQIVLTKKLIQIKNDKKEKENLKAKNQDDLWILKSWA